MTVCVLEYEYLFIYSHRLTLDGDAFLVFEQFAVFWILNGRMFRPAGHLCAIIGSVGLDGDFTNGSESAVSVSRKDVFASF